MNKDQAANLLTLVKNLFPTIDADQGKMLLDEVKNFDFTHAVADVKTHASDRERKDYGSYVFFPAPLLDRMKASEAKRRQRIAASLQETTATSLRRDGAGKWRHHDDKALLIEHFCNAWEELRDAQNVEAVPRQQVKAYMYASALRAFEQINLSDEVAMQLTEACLELSPGEIVSAPKMASFIKSVPQASDSPSGVAIQALAKAELAMA